MARLLALVALVVFLGACGGGGDLGRESPAGTAREDAPRYQVTDIGSLGGTSVNVSAINNKGQVTGYSQFANDPTDPSKWRGPHAFLYSDGTMYDLRTLHGDGFGWGNPSFGYALNDKGHVSGTSYHPSGTASHAFLYRDGTMHDLGVFVGNWDDGWFTFAYGINNKGQIVGEHRCRCGGGPFNAVLYSDGRWRDLGSLGGNYSKATDINNRGHVTGYSTLTAGFVGEHAFLYDGRMKDLGTLGGSASSGNAINDAGQITGRSRTAGDAEEHAFLYSNGVMQDLGTLGGLTSSGDAINNKGQITGTSTTQSGETRAILYSNGQMYDLNGLVDGSGAGWVLLESKGINEAGQIAGNGTFNGQQRGFLLTPLD